MGFKKVILIIIVLILALLILIGTYWFDSHFGKAEVSDKPVHDPSTADTSEDIPEADTSEDKADADKIVAPDFTVYDADGNPVKLTDFAGKPVILNFWASWCGPCKSEMPDFQEKYTQYAEDIHFLMVNLTDNSRETVQTASEFITDSGYTFPVYFDSDSQAASAYGIRSIPTTFFIDAEGYAVAQATGAIDSITLQKGINMIYTAPTAEDTETNENPDA